MSTDKITVVMQKSKEVKYSVVYKSEDIPAFYVPKILLLQLIESKGKYPNLLSVSISLPAKQEP